MRQKVLLGLTVLMLLMTYSCRKSDIEQNENLERPNKKRLSTWDYTWGPPPSPMEWIKDRDGTGPYQPSGPNYFYVGDEPDSKIGNDYTNYAHFYWSSVPEDDEHGHPLANKYLMQIQWRFDEYGPWYYANNLGRGYGLVSVLHDGVLADIPAFAFPYSNKDEFISLRIRLIHKDFLTASPDFYADYMYDRTLVSDWSYTEFRYYNPWGDGMPQPLPTGNGGWTSGDPDTMLDGQFSVTVELPVQYGYNFSYNIFNITGGYTETFGNKSPDLFGKSKSSMMAIGYTGGTVSVVATRSDNHSADVSSVTQEAHYTFGTKNIYISFSQAQFDR